MDGGLDSERITTTYRCRQLAYISQCISKAEMYTQMIDARYTVERKD